MEILNNLNLPEDIKKLNMDGLRTLAKEIRQVILDTVLTNGGHLASSLGAVEIIIAMYYVFDAPEDKFIFDVGHQCYAHKLLTGRFKQFNTLRKKDGVAGFPKRSESIYDIVNTGHSSTSLSVACGITRAMELNDDKHVTVALIGDGALTGGLAYEALNDGSDIKHKQIIILNDNSMSISQNVGSTAKYLLKLHTSDVYKSFKQSAIGFVNTLDVGGQEKTFKFLSNARNSIKYFLQGGLPFEQFDMHYFGPIDGNDIEQMVKALQIAKRENDSVIIHAVTVKGRGFKEAEDNPAKYHGYSPSKSSGVTFSDAFGEGMMAIAQNNDKVFAITAAMTDGVGLKDYASSFSNRFADVGIAEAHAVTMASGLAIGGYKPYFAVYSSFLQRAYDSVIHDVSLQDLAVTFCIDRAGIVPGDGETHQGIYDLAYLRIIPNMTVVAPASLGELKAILRWSLDFNHPLAIRYPKAVGKLEYDGSEIILGKWHHVIANNSDIHILATGARMCEEGSKAAAILAKQGIEVNLINCSFVKPLDREYLSNIKTGYVFTLEDNLIAGGFGSAVCEELIFNGSKARIKLFGINNISPEHASVDELMLDCGLDADSIVSGIKEILNET